MLQPLSILVIDHDDAIRPLLRILNDEYLVRSGNINNLVNYPDCTMVIVSAIKSLSVIEHIRKTNQHIPIIVWSEDTSEATEVSNLWAGATDYIQKPYRTSALHARMARHIATYKEYAPRRVGNWVWYPKRDCVILEKGVTVPITRKENRILSALVNGGINGVARRELVEILGYKEDCDTRAVETCMYRLRSKLDTRDTYEEHWILFHTTHNGYRLATTPRREQKSATL